MSWRTKDVEQQRVEFVVRASRGESLSALCREFEITRPTGYLWLRRFQQGGARALEEHSRRPRRSPRQTGADLERRIVQLRETRPDWGARKLAVLLEREGVVLPVITIHRVLVRHGLVIGTTVRRGPSAWRPAGRSSETRPAVGRAPPRCGWSRSAPARLGNGCDHPGWTADRWWPQIPSAP
jgi:transposase-like protein